QRRLERPAIDLEEHLPLVNGRAFLVVALQQVAADLRPDLCVDVTVERGNPFARQRDALRSDGDHRHARWWRRRRGGLAFLTRLNERRHQRQREETNDCTNVCHDITASQKPVKLDAYPSAADPRWSRTND